MSQHPILPIPALTDRQATRFWSRVEKTETCWLWKSHMGTGGYGLFSVRNRHYRAHRVAYALLVGPIPDGLQLDHLCRVRHCVNPNHLEPVTPAENSRRGIAVTVNTARQQGKTHCPADHPYAGENLHIRYGPEGQVWRFCRTCERERDRKRGWRRPHHARAAAAAAEVS